MQSTSKSSSARTAVQEPEAWSEGAIQGFLSGRARRVPAGPQQSSGWARGNAIGLTGGIPDPEYLPLDALREALLTVLGREHKPALEYGGAQGLPELRTYVATQVCAEPGVAMTAENVTLTSGSSHSLANIVDTFIDPGDVIIVELPSFSGALRTFRSGGAELVGVPMDEEGIDTEALDRTLSRLESEDRKVKFLYTIQNFHNPTGITQTLERRKALIDVAARHQLLIVDDEPYGEFRFRGDTVPSLLALSGGEGVLGVGTFSKIIATGLRCAWVMGKKPYIDALVSTRFDGGSTPLVQRMVAAYIEAGHLQPHIEKMTAVYNEKCETMLRALDERCATRISYTRPEGGFFIWATLPENIDAMDLVKATQDEGVAIVPGMGYMATPELGRHNFRLAFSQVPEEQIFDAIQRLGRALEKAERR
jgi:2-aminoadipate transaminase